MHGARSLYDPEAQRNGALAPPSLLALKGTHPTTPSYPTHPYTFFCHHQPPAPYPLKPMKSLSHQLTESHQWAGSKTKRCSPCQERNRRKPPHFSNKRQNYSIPALLTLQDYNKTSMTTHSYSATSKYRSNMLEHLRTMKTLFPYLCNLINSVISVLQISASIVVFNQAKLILPNNTTRETLVSFQPSEKLIPPPPLQPPKAQKLWPLHRTHSQIPSSTIKIKVNNHTSPREQTQTEKMPPHTDERERERERERFSRNPLKNLYKIHTE
jgi:hypothetical protein